MANTEKDLSTWSREWVVTEGQMKCATCGKTQLIEEADTAFEHLASCAGNTYPWIELHDVLDRQRG